MKIIRKEIPNICWACNGVGVGCKVCDNTGKYKEVINYIVYEKDGKKFAVDSDNIG